jgi:hypothetical protein
MRHGWTRNLAAALFSSAALTAAEPAVLPAVEVSVSSPAPVADAPNPLPGVASIAAAASAPMQLPPVDSLSAKPLPNPGSLTTATPTSPANCTFLPDPCQVCQPRPRFWGQLDYLLWFPGDIRLSEPIYTTAPPQGAGALGEPGTRVIYGGNDVGLDAANGVRLTMGGWLNPHETWGVEASGFLLEQVSDGFRVDNGPNATTGLFRPILADARPNPVEAAIVLADPPQVTGSATAVATSRLWGADINALYNLRNTSCYRFDGLFGFRYLDLTQSLSFNTVSVFPAPISETVDVADNFETRNQFYGPQVGGRLTLDRGRVGFVTSLKVGLGVMHETLEIAGTRSVNGVVTGPGILANAANSGRYSRDRFAAVPELGLRLNYRFAENVSGSVGYDFLYLSDVLAPGDQITRNFPGVAAPMVSADYFTHGLTLGLGLRY